MDEFRGINELQAALHIDEADVPQAVGCFAGNVCGSDLVAIQAQHPHPREVHHVDRTAETAQGELCETQECSQWMLNI